MNDPVMNPIDPEQGTPASSPASEPKESVGTRLRSEREARSWTVEHVASQLNLAPRQVEALEQDNFAALPGMAIARGFIRAYAKLLKIDPAILMDLIPSESTQSSEPLPARPTLATPFSRGTGLPSLHGGTPGSRRTLILAALGALVAFGYAALQLGWLPAASLPFAMPGMADVAPKDAQPAAGNAGEATPAPSAPTEATPAAPAELPPPEPAGESMSPSPAAETPAEAPKTQEPAAAAKVADKNALVLTMHEDSWIEVRRAGADPQSAGAVQMARLVKAGSSETIDVSEPVILTVGNVNGVEASLRGAAFDLKAGAKNNVARINVK